MNANSTNSNSTGNTNATQPMPMSMNSTQPTNTNSTGSDSTNSTSSTSMPTSPPENISEYVTQVYAEIKEMLVEEPGKSISFSDCLSPIFTSFEKEFYDMQTEILSCLAN